MKKIYFIFTLFISFALMSKATTGGCPQGKKQVEITIVTDNYGPENEWSLKDNFGNILATGSGYNANQTYVQSVCVDTMMCLTFTILDGFGDGMCCAYGNGSYTIKYDGVTIATGGSFGSKESVTFDCGPGTSCVTALPISKGIHKSPSTDTWYEYIPDSSGVYKFSTCNLGNTCDTKVWVYEGKCSELNITDTHTGTIIFDDNAGGCGLFAVAEGYLEKNKKYYIRVGAALACADSIDFELIYTGPLRGCTDNTACNYNALAVVDDGSCLYFPNPLCQQPDLMVDQNAISNTMYLSQVNAGNDPCAITEGCLNGYGMRTVIRFDTYIKNIGNLDYFIGSPSATPAQFSTDNCHGHPHYEGYSEYVLYKQNSNNLPIGFKNGFCVLDYDGCPGGGSPKYTCNNMGVSTGCGDIYEASLDCQWIDITDVDTGDYIFAVKVNWDQSPDALGHHESNYQNNWAQVCINIYDSAGQKRFTQLTNCPPYVDCAGNQYGHAVKDCNGNCNGTTKMGDLDNNNQQQLADAQMYVSKIVDNSITPTSCNDLNNDALITVWDAALLNNCIKNGTNSNIKCLFPHRLTNPHQEVTLSIGAVNTSQNYIDINIENPTSAIVAYEFDVTGLNILSVQNLINTTNYPVTPNYKVGGNKVASIRI